MCRGFELKDLKKSFFGDDYQKYYFIGGRNFKPYKNEVQEALKAFENSDKSLNGDKMQSNWFPQMKADVFLSHSHVDEDLVIAFAGWLKEHFDLDSFIDSCVWGYSMELQKLIDRESVQIKDGKRMLNYEKVLYTASHVHMMLNAALMQMIDSCECVIFINTPNSVKPNEVIDKLVSPWIYSELGMTKLIKMKSAKEYRGIILKESSDFFSELSMSYNLDTDHLTQIAPSKLRVWKFMNTTDKEEYPLDFLYEMEY